MNAPNIDINPEVKVTISAKLLWAAFIGLVAIIGSIFVTYYDIKATFQKQDYEIRVINYRLDKLEGKK